MKVYINNTVLHFKNVSVKFIGDYDQVLDSLKGVNVNSLKNKVLFQQFNSEDATSVLNFIESGSAKKLESVTFSTNDKDLVKKFFKSKYNFIKAAGGLVRKGDKYLFIYRLKKWDLPKGKLEKGEEVKECAVREVEEECSIKVKAVTKIGSTWHCYATKNGWCVKKTSWFLMNCLDDTGMKPQIQEDIEDITWVPPQNVDKYLENSFGTIKDVFVKAKKKGLI